MKKILATALVLIGTLSAGVTIGDNIKLNPIKPAGNKALTDEQQGILAVRMAKASVVSIVGETKEKIVTPVNGTITLDDLELTVFGTGFIWSADGLIVTNNHVVETANLEYTVTLLDGTSYPAKILAADKLNDIAVLKIEAKNLTPAKLGDSDILETGQSVFAIGDALGKYQNSVSRGVVSGLLRKIDIGSQGNPKPRLMNLIQTDAAINPGNSGGPLINFSGEVVGMTTLMDNEAQGLGFAIAINTVKISVNQLVSTGKVSRPFVGLTFLTITKDVGKVRQLSVNQGALVVVAAPGGPAALAGLTTGDIIVDIGGQKLDQSHELDTVVMNYKAGDTVLFTYMRGSEKLQTPVLLQEYVTK